MSITLVLTELPGLTDTLACMAARSTGAPVRRPVAPFSPVSVGVESSFSVVLGTVSLKSRSVPVLSLRRSLWLNFKETTVQSEWL